MNTPISKVAYNLKISLKNINMNARKYNKETFTKGMYDIFGKDEVDNHKIIGIGFELL